MKAKNVSKRLGARIADWSKTMSGSHPGQGKVATRVGTRGYHKPGSNKK